MTQLFNILLVALGIGFLIFIHELGHYLAARLAGVRVLTFSLGFGPRIFGFRRGPTDYRLSAVPLGGYVRVAGEDPTLREGLEPDDLHAKGFLARTLFFSGGVLMNLLFAVIAFPFIFNAGVDFTAPVVGAVQRGSPAWEARLQPGDRILSVHGKRMYSFENMAVELALAGGPEVELLVERDGRQFTQRVRPRWSPEQGIRTIGIEPARDPELPRLQVDEDSPAAKAGVQTGDRLLRVNGEQVDGTTFLRVLRDAEPAPDKELALTVLRDGEEKGPFRFFPRAEQTTQRRIGVARARRLVAGLRPAPLLDRLGLQVGDHIQRVDGKRFGGGDFAAFAQGPDQLTMTVLRPGVAEPLQLRAGVSAEERRQLDDWIGLQVDQIGVVVEPAPDTPAARAGLVAGDEIQRAGERDLADWQDLIEVVQGAGDAPLQLVVRGDDGQRAVTLTPQHLPVADLGFTTVARAALRETYRVESVGGAITAGLVASADLIKQLYVTLKRLFTGDVAASNLGGIITISRVSYDQAQSGWARFFYFLALLSINLAFINVLPIPVLDGGHLLFLLIEKIKGSPVSARVLNYSQLLGLVFVVALMVYVTFNDIRRLF